MLALIDAAICHHVNTDPANNWRYFRLIAARMWAVRRARPDWVITDDSCVKSDPPRRGATERLHPW